ncbi:uroporphyrinogen-III synthase, partial [Caballeronia sp. M23-90]
MASAHDSTHTPAEATPRPSTVVITRPSGQSAELMALLERAGFEPLEFPLIDIGPVADTAPLQAALGELYAPAELGFALVVFVSPNAVQHAFAGLSAPWPAHV